MSAWRCLWSAAGMLSLASVLAQPACARQDSGAGARAEAAQDTAAARWQRRVAEAEQRVAGAPADVRARRELVSLLLRLGRARDAEAAAAESGSAELANAHGEALFALGRWADAAAAYRRALDGKASDAIEARANLALLLQRRGDPSATAELERVVAWYARAASPDAAQLTAAGRALRALGERDPQRFHDAVRAFEEAVRVSPDALPPRLEEADLFLAKYSSTEAQALVREVLQREPSEPRALLLLARAKKFDGSDEALSLVRRALALAPGLVAARVFHGELLLGLEDYEGATREAEQALENDPASLEALTLLAATRLLAGDQAGFTGAVERALALNPRYAAAYSTTAELAAQQRRYAEAAALAERAVQLDSTDWSGWTQLGLNQFRLGQVQRARASLERGFAGDPFNIWVKNTLDLLDTYPQYVERSSERLTLFLHGDEADLLQLYALPLAEAAMDSLSRRYGYRPSGRVRVEVFPRHADFSVRTIGLAGLGALGVSFGDQLVMDSPAARERGEFNWGSTLWHELAHTYTLGLSHNRVPRWLTEGISVYEERRARPGWGEELNPGFAQAYGAGMLPPVSRLNEGFVRPKYPEEILHSYFLASLVVEYIERQYGASAVRDLLQAYGQGRSTEQAFASTLKVKPAEFDRQFDAWLKQRYARQLAAARSEGEQPGEYLRLVTQARALIQAGQSDAAKRALEQAKAAFPEYAGQGSAYHLLADLYERAGDRARAAAELERVLLLQDDDYDAMTRAAALRLAGGDTARAAAALERTLYVHPYDPAVHAELAQLYTRLGRSQEAVRERRAIVALDPVDIAEARYQLALALERAGDRAAARTEVLRALETAPNYAAAQELLLRLSGGAP